MAFTQVLLLVLIICLFSKAEQATIDHLDNQQLKIDSPSFTNPSKMLLEIMSFESLRLEGYSTQKTTKKQAFGDESLQETMIAEKQQGQYQQQSLTTKTELDSSKYAQSTSINPIKSTEDSQCEITCLQCDQSGCIRYNWIALFCVVMLIINLMALGLFLKRKFGSHKLRNDSLITDISKDSISRMSIQ